MDEIDVALCRYLIYNSRISYSDLAKALDISVQSAHRRVQDLIEAGVIGKFSADFSPRAYRSVWVMVHGRSDATSIEAVLESLKGDKEMDMAMVASGKYLYIGGAVTDPGRINRFVASVTKAAKMEKPQVGIVYNPTLMDVEGEAIVYPMDVRIMQALKDDARKPLTELAKELGVAPRTVTRHIDRLMKEMLIHFGFEWYPQLSREIIAAVHLKVRKGKEREKVAAALIKRLAMRELITYSFSDRPDYMICLVWSPSIMSLNDLVRELEGDGMYDEVVPNIIMDARYYEGIKATTPPTSGGASK